MPFTPTASQIVEMLPSSGLTLGRLGGSDFDAVSAILESKSLNQAAKTALELRIPPWSHLGRVCKLNGFFTSEGVSRSGAHKELLEYLSELLESWRNFDISFVAHPLLRPDLVDFEDNARGMVAKRIVGSKEWLPFGFLEEVRSLLEGIERWPPGTKCLVVSPFSQSIEYQKKRLDELVPGVDLSHISFSTMDVPITYSTPRARRDPTPQGSLVRRESSWKETLSEAKSELSQIDFDVALISAGSYTGPLLAQVKACQKSGLYLGGLLMPLFNLDSTRFNTRFFRQFSNTATLLRPLEMDRLTTISAGFHLPNEALRAYLPDQR